MKHLYLQRVVFQERKTKLIGNLNLLKWQEAHLLEKEMAPHSSILEWKIPWMEKPGRLQSMGSPRVRNSWATNTHTDTQTHRHTHTHVHLPSTLEGNMASVFHGCQKPALCFMKGYHFYLSISLKRQSGRKGS